MSMKKTSKLSRSATSQKVNSRKNDKKSSTKVLDKLNSLDVVQDDNRCFLSPLAVHNQTSVKVLNLPIWDEQITKLRISHNSLMSLRVELESKRKFNTIKETQYITVRKKVKDNAKSQSVQVVRPAPGDAKLRVNNISRYKGPKLDKYGRINPHSILGEVEDFKREALKRGEFSDLFPVKPVKTVNSHPKKAKLRIQRVLNSKNSLLTWEREMKQWRKQLSHLTGCINRDAGNMIMTRSQNACTVQEKKELNSYNQDAYPDAGFWRQTRWCGPKEYCIGNTLTMREHGYPTFPSVSGDAAYIQAEKGTIQTNYTSQFWSKLEKEKSGTSQGTIHIMDITKFKDLGVFTKPINNISSKKEKMTQIEKHLCDSAGKPLVDFEKSSVNMGAKCGSCEEASTDKNYKVSAPALVIMGTLLPWMGPAKASLDTEAAMVTALTFDGFVGELLTRRLEMSNIGSTVVHFYFRKCPTRKSYLPDPHKSSPFYFFGSEGVLLPGESVKIRVIFKSKKPGYFSQTWRVHTQPILCGGRTAQVTLKAAIMSRPEDASSIEEIKGSLHHREAQMITKYITQIWLKGILGVLEIKEKHIPPSPLNDLLNEEEIFAEANPKYHYKFTEVQQLLTLSMETAQYVQDMKTKDMLTQPQYCLSLAFLRKVISELPDDVTRIDGLVVSPDTISSNMPRTVTWSKVSKSCESQTSSIAVDGISTISVKEKLLERLANLVMELSFSPIEMKDFWKRQKYCFGQGLIRMALDRMTTQVLYIAKTFNQALIWDVGDVQAEQKFEESNTITTRNSISPKPFSQKRNVRSAPVASLQAKPANKGQKVDIPLKNTQQPEQHTSAKKDPKRKKNDLSSQIVVPMVQVIQAKKSTHALMRGTPEFRLFHEKIEMMVYKILKSTVMKLVDLLEESYKGQETDIFATFRNRE